MERKILNSLTEGKNYQTNRIKSYVPKICQITTKTSTEYNLIYWIKIYDAPSPERTIQKPYCLNRLSLYRRDTLKFLFFCDSGYLVS